MVKKTLLKGWEQTKSGLSKTEGEKQIGKQAYSEQDKARINEFRRRKSAYRPIKIIQDDDDKLFWDISLMESTGTIDADLANTFITQAAKTFPNANSNIGKSINECLVAMHNIAPRDTLEGMLAAQMVGAHNLSMEYMERALIKGQHPDAIKAYSSLSNKFMRTFTQQLEALNRYRGKGQQKVTVEHIHVNEGGQAIVGNIEKAGGGGED